MTKFRLLLRDLRQRRELSQDELARQIGISRQSVISLERGEYLPSLPLLVALIEFFDCPLEQLVEGVRTESQEKFGKLKKGGEQEQMQITRWDPFGAIDRMRDEIDELVERTFGRGDWSQALASSVGAMNIHEDDSQYELEFQAPGFSEKDISIELSDNTLTVSGKKESKEEEKKGRRVVRREWSSAEFSRSVRFAQPIKEDKIEAKLANGTLRIIAPKVEPIKPKVKKIEVKK